MKHWNTRDLFVGMRLHEEQLRLQPRLRLLTSGMSERSVEPFMETLVMTLGTRPRLMKWLNLWEIKDPLVTKMISAEPKALHRFMTKTNSVLDAASKLFWNLDVSSDLRYECLEQLCHSLVYFL